MRSIFLPAVVVTTVAALVFTWPAFARGGPGVGGAGSGQSTGGGQFSRSATPSGFTSSGQRQGWTNAKTPPGWSHGKKKGWDGGKMPPGLSRRDHDRDWRDRKFDRGDERGDRDRGQFHTGQLERRWGW